MFHCSELYLSENKSKKHLSVNSAFIIDFLKVDVIRERDVTHLAVRLQPTGGVDSVAKEAILWCFDPHHTGYHATAMQT